MTEHPTTGSGNDMLLRLIDSPQFDLFMCLNYLQKYADNIGIHYYICKRVSRYPISELRFFIPQFLQLLITVETESMALEELIKRLCNQDVHFSLIAFWHLQALLQELSKEPESVGFQTCKRMLNDLQFQLFNISNSQYTTTSSSSASSGVISKHDSNSKEFRENVAPSIILATSLIAGIGMPKATRYVEPIVRVQGRQLKSLVFEVVKDIKKNLTENITKKNTINNALMGRSKEEFEELKRSKSATKQKRAVSTSSISSLPPGTASKLRNNQLDFEMIDTYADMNMPNLSRQSLKLKSSKSLLQLKSNSETFSTQHATSLNSSPVLPQERKLEHMTNSMPNLHLTPSLSSSTDLIPYSSDGSYASSIRNSFDNRDSSEVESLYGGDGSDSPSAGSPTSKSSNSTVPLTIPQRVKLLKSNYFKFETQFMIALQNISIRLSKVPKEARLSTLKAELSMLNKDLPCEVDIPALLPKNKKGKLHKVCRIAVNEAAVLNSAERVPYLLLIEYLVDEIDFDPTTTGNKQVLNKLEDNKGGNTDSFRLTDKKYRFDLAFPHHAQSPSSSVASFDNPLLRPSPQASNSILYTPERSDSRESHLSTTTYPLVTEESDLGDVSVVKMTNSIEKQTYMAQKFVKSQGTIPKLTAQPSSPSLTVYTSATAVDTANSKNIEENVRNIELTFKSHYNNDSLENDNDLANQMRIAAVMLTQLDSPASTMPVTQAAQIKARIIDSMKSMQNGFGVEDLEDIRGEAGERKLSNDLKVAGLSYLGEDWNTKRERIRKESKYGHLDNWELCSVIAKTGDDLTQEAFACQLIQAMANIWYKDDVRVWVKRMRILVTSSNTGLVETITNALSVHSIKKSLTHHMTMNNENPGGEIATLKNHFVRLFGEENSPRYKMAQDNFCISLAAYSVICYVLQIKDRHNGNIMLDSEGHIVHIDFGFLLSNSPGSVGFEAAPFKMTTEYVDLLGGINSFYFNKFKQLMKDAFKSLRRNSDSLVNMVELMQRDSQLPCFKAGENTSVQMKQRLQLHLSEEDLDLFIENVLLNKSVGSIYTRLYDQFQLLTQGIYI
ncbi:hypothetical protein CANARDRAFT_26972 [[Candida] arabinofermentans NRRL YB-2248]|uniref:1-phosphatidylinositol 4-kinase n=1 Tax=[Candida] arabinofermentans NRRL YB-2248 TaxID=983967 RepID=A0A1E4T777_9ASCO|nr:hypothetical protein CANARDRAFT_26972 [[Candida] arabinofermentans NRRL YB-2248]